MNRRLIYGQILKIVMCQLVGNSKAAPQGPPDPPPSPPADPPPPAGAPPPGAPPAPSGGGGAAGGSSNRPMVEINLDAETTISPREIEIDAAIEQMKTTQCTTVFGDCWSKTSAKYWIS